MKRNFDQAMDVMSKPISGGSERRSGTTAATSNSKAFGADLRERLEKQADAQSEVTLAIALIDDNPFQIFARETTDESALNELADSITTNGFYGSLVVRPKPGREGRYEQAFGHRRKAAAKIAGLNDLPVKVVNLNDEQMLSVMASENFSRLDLSPIAEANVVGQIAATTNKTAGEIAKSIGKKPDWVDLRLALYEAPQDIRQMVEQKPTTLTYVKLLRQVSGDQRSELIKAVLEGELNRDQLRAKISSLKSPAFTALDPNSSNALPNVVESSTGITTPETSTTQQISNQPIVKNVTNSVLDGISEMLHNPTTTNMDVVNPDNNTYVDISVPAKLEPAKVNSSLTLTPFEPSDAYIQELTQSVGKIEAAVSYLEYFINQRGLLSTIPNQKIEALAERLLAIVRDSQEPRLN